MMSRSLALFWKHDDVVTAGRKAVASFENHAIMQSRESLQSNDLLTNGL